MDITISTEEFLKLQQATSAKDIETSKLKEQVALLKEERDQWMARALKAEDVLKTEEALNVEMVMDSATEKEQSSSGGVIVLSVELLKAILSKIHNLHILAIIALVLQKALHRKASAEESRQIAEMVPLPNLPSINLTANGDIDVEGDWNDVHDNTNVNL
jgi:hypothetical protein